MYVHTCSFTSKNQLKIESCIIYRACFYIYLNGMDIIQVIKIKEQRKKAKLIKRSHDGQVAFSIFANTSFRFKS